MSVGRIRRVSQKPKRRHVFKAQLPLFGLLSDRGGEDRSGGRRAAADKEPFTAGSAGRIVGERSKKNDNDNEGAGLVFPKKETQQQRNEGRPRTRPKSGQTIEIEIVHAPEGISANRIISALKALLAPHRK